MYLFLVDNNEHKKAKSMSKNVVAKISQMNIKILLLNRKCIRHSKNRIQSKDHIYIYKTMDMRDEHWVIKIN